ncbi:MAG: hypothetical protein H6Q71_1486 [Firmicutes bacterium]|nr:hypothetical protein [Bacillota bacterium]
MASYFKRGKKWYYSIDVGVDADGKRLKQSRGGFLKRQDAVDAASQVQLDVSNGVFINEKDITFGEFAAEWLKIYSCSNKVSTVATRGVEVKRLNKFFNKIKIGNITRLKYQASLLEMDKKYSKNTLSGTHVAAKMIFRKAVEMEVIKNNPTDFVKLPKKVETLEDVENKTDIPKYLEKDELAILLQNAKDRDYTIFLLLAYTGIRVGELCGLKWSDIDFSENTIKINRTYYADSKSKRKFIVQPPKTKHSQRTIVVSKKVIAELEKHKAKQNIKKLKKRYLWLDENFVFTSSKHPGFPMSPKSVRGRMEKLLEQSSLSPTLSPHSLRHTHTSLLAEAGVGLEEIMERLGHISDKTTREVYLHVTNKMKKEAVHKFDALMDNL